MLPVVGDEGEVLEIDEAVEVEVAGGPGLLGGLPVVGDEGLVLDIDDAVIIGVAEVGDCDEEIGGIEGWLPRDWRLRSALSKRATA